MKKKSIEMRTKELFAVLDKLVEAAELKGYQIACYEDEAGYLSVSDGTIEEDREKVELLLTQVRAEAIALAAGIK